MSGYIAPEHRWASFETAARRIFDAFGVAELHAKEFNDTKDDFKGWSRRKKEAFVLCLYSELRRNSVLGIDSGIARSAYNRARFELGHYPNQSRYGNCFAWIVDTIMRSDMMQYYATTHKATLKFIVEAGNKNDSDIVRTFDEMKHNPYHRGVVDVMDSVSFVEKGSTIALQMADFLAFHSRRCKTQCDKARRYLAMTDLQKMIFYGVDTKTHLSHGYLTDEEIAAGILVPDTWRNTDAS
ncbi:DUF3800 domain-containing protein [Bradyrhizobium brasilense]|nr:DUF3800 domain-containing protein [Bradyrhizobium brasilense]